MISSYLYNFQPTNFNFFAYGLPSFNLWGLETESQSKLRFLDGVFHTCDKVRRSERENSYDNHDHGNILYIREHYFVLKKLNLVFFISFENVFEKLNSKPCKNQKTFKFSTTLSKIFYNFQMSTYAFATI